MKNLLKKNQLMITALALMIAVAGYLQFSGKTMEDEEYVATSGEAQSDVEHFTASNVSEDYTLDGLLELSEEELLSSGQLTEIDSLDSDAEIITDDYLDEGMSVAVDAGAQTAEKPATPDDGEIPGEAVFTSSATVTSLSDAKLLKEQVRARNKEMLMEIINSSGLSDDQKLTAVNAMVKMTEIAEKEMGAEILLEAKGFSDVIVSISDDSVDVVVNAAELSDAQRAQIVDILVRKTEVEAQNIIISTVVQ